MRFSARASAHLLAVLLASTSPATAWAEGPDPKAEGDALMDSFKYSEALEKYRQAYALTGTPTLLYNQGRALELMGRFPEALEQLRAFEANAPPEMRALVPNLKALIDEVESKTCVLDVVVREPAATVKLGDVVLGPAPIQARRVNAIAKARIEVTAEGYEPQTRDVALPGKGNVSLRFELVPRDKRSVLVIDSPVRGATITVDGRSVGQVPTEVRLEPGTHEVHLEAAGYSDNSVEVVLGAAERRQITIEPGSAPIYEEWWFWTLTGALVAGAGTAVIVYAATTEGDPDRGTIDPGTAPVFLGTRGEATFRVGPAPVFTLRF